MQEVPENKVCPDQTKAKVIIYGGNGFVGTRVAKRLAETNAYTVCLSRSGHKPLHLLDKNWSQQVCWSKGDASQPNVKLLATADCLICLVGSPPLPTFSKQAYEQQVFMNGTTNQMAIEAAAKAGLKKVVLVGAKIPGLIDKSSFGYAQGKQLSFEAARQFADLSDEHSAIVLQPGAVVGRRYLSSGKSINLNLIFGPIAKIMRGQFVEVDRLANRIVEAALVKEPYHGKFTIIKNADI